MNQLFGDYLTFEKYESGAYSSSVGTIRNSTNQIIEGEIDEEWSTPLAKISRLYYDHESWSNAKEILEIPSPACRKIGDEARGIAARHIIDRLSELHLLSSIQSVAPRLRSAVELLSKTDADYLYPSIQFVLNDLRFKYPDIYESAVKKIGLRIPEDMGPKMVIVTIAKFMFENTSGDVEINWGKFASLLCLCGTIAVDSVENGYGEGVAEIVDTFGLIIEQVMGNWILSNDGGGGWEGFIQMNQYEPILSPLPRTIVILLVFITFIILLIFVSYSIFNYFFDVHEFNSTRSESMSTNLKIIGKLTNQHESIYYETCPKPSFVKDFLFN